MTANPSRPLEAAAAAVCAMGLAGEIARCRLTEADGNSSYRNYIIGIAGAIFLPLYDITDFLYFIGSVFAPMIAIQIADFFILKKDSTEKSFDIQNLIIWLVGFVIYRPLMRVDFILGSTLPDMAITLVICVADNKIGKLCKKSSKNQSLVLSPLIFRGLFSQKFKPCSQSESKAFLLSADIFRH